MPPLVVISARAVPRQGHLGHSDPCIGISGLDYCSGGWWSLDLVAPRPWQSLGGHTVGAKKVGPCEVSRDRVATFVVREICDLQYSKSCLFKVKFC